MNKFDYCMQTLLKTAEEEEPRRNPYLAAGKVLGSGLLGMGAGYLTGFGVGKGLEYVTGKAGGNPANVARKVAPLAGGALGILYPMWKAREQQEMRDAFESARDQAERGNPGQ